MQVAKELFSHVTILMDGLYSSNCMASLYKLIITVLAFYYTLVADCLEVKHMNRINKSSITSNVTLKRQFSLFILSI